MCKRGVTDSSASDGNILASAKVWGSIPLLSRTFNELQFVGWGDGVPYICCHDLRVLCLIDVKKRFVTWK